MKRFYSPRRHSFTLVELLVVLGIIAILAAVTLGAANAVIRTAKRARASVLANQIQTACMNYYADYSLYPVATGTTADLLYTDVSSTSTTSTWAILTYALCGNINPYTGAAPAAGNVPNPRAITYLTLNRSDVATTSGVPINPLPWNTANTFFNIAFDSDYSGIIGDNPTTAQPINFSTSTATSIKNSPLAAGVAVWANCNTSTTSTNLNFYVHTY